MTRKPIFSLLLFIAILSLLSGCFMDPARRARIAAQNEALRTANEHMGTIRTVGLVGPEIRVVEFSTKSQLELYLWADEVRPHVIDTLKRALSDCGMTVTVIAPKGGPAKELRTRSAEYRGITNRLGWNATYRKEVCALNRNCRPHSLGPVARFFEGTDVDALLFVLAENDIETDDAKEARRKYNVKRALAGALGTIYISIDRHPGLYMSMGLVNRQGEVFWYSSKWIGKEADIRDQETVAELAKRILLRLKGKER